MTIGSYLAWLGVADLGLGNDARTCSSAAFGRNDERAAREAVATAFWMLHRGGGESPRGGSPAGWMVDWPALINVRTRRRPPPRSGRRSGSPSRSSASPSRSSVVAASTTPSRKGPPRTPGASPPTSLRSPGSSGSIEARGGPRLARRGHQRRRVPCEGSECRLALPEAGRTCARAGTPRPARPRPGWRPAEAVLLVQIAALVLYSTTTS